MNLVPKVDRALALLRLASNDGAADHERSTSALLFVRLIIKYDLRIVAPPPTPSHDAHREPVDDDDDEDADDDAPRVIDSKFAGRCRACGARHAVGDPIAWSPSIRGALCLRCWRETRERRSA